MKWEKRRDQGQGEGADQGAGRSRREEDQSGRGAGAQLGQVWRVQREIGVSGTREEGDPGEEWTV